MRLEEGQSMGNKNKKPSCKYDVAETTEELKFLFIDSLVALMRSLHSAIDIFYFIFLHLSINMLKERFPDKSKRLLQQ